MFIDLWRVFLKAFCKCLILRYYCETEKVSIFFKKNIYIVYFVMVFCLTERWQLQLSISSYIDSDVGEFYLILMFVDEFYSRDLIRYGLMPASNSDKLFYFITLFYSFFLYKIQFLLNEFGFFFRFWKQTFEFERIRKS